MEGGQRRGLGNKSLLPLKPVDVEGGGGMSPWGKGGQHVVRIVQSHARLLAERIRVMLRETGSGAHC
ncbi:hypothetical protein E2C01_043445 [Portunus trituberculatus]|uniref:Uncharacterized protein n=1 Tax=Portunus trituberculatus TaxID=210409 RepID=A0A5B7FVS1_PORTR|nr:hypothetical protein [Portunus trituberculatus]